MTKIIFHGVLCVASAVTGFSLVVTHGRLPFEKMSGVDNTIALWGIMLIILSFVDEMFE